MRASLRGAHIRIGSGRRSRWMRTLIPALLAFTALGCGGATATKTAARTSAPVPTAAAQKAAATTKQVKIADYDYSPRTLHVAVGTKVTWTNKDATNHTVTFKSGVKSPGKLNRGQKRSVTFGKAGTFKYVCQYHPNMHGTVVVR